MRESVKWFTEQMERKLQEHDDRNGWDNCQIGWLMKRIREELEEVRVAWVEARLGSEWQSVIDEAADVANFAMMIADNARQEMDNS